MDRIYFENGQMRREVRLVNGLKEGIMTDFYNDGKLKSMRNFKQNIQCGKTTFYHPDGISLKEVQYYDENGLRTLGDTLWYTNGQIEFMADFKFGKKNGNLSRFDSTGKLLYNAIFANDTLVKVL
jgi:antitoxin component YwqK of YwqJK toxin-antitoxin module